MRWAIIENGVVTNIAVADAQFASEQGWVAAPSAAAPGWLYADDTFTAPAAPPSVPVGVTARQARLSLLASGLLDNAEAALAALPDPQRTAAEIEWEYASEIRRESPLVAAIGAALGLTGGQVDDLFRAAAVL